MKARLAKLERVLVPVDFSPCAHRALLFGRALGAPTRARIHLLHVYAAPSGPFAERFAAEVEGRGRVTLDTLAREEAERELTEFLEAAGRPDVEALLVAGTPGRAILEVAQQGDFDLIVMGTHGRTGLERLLMGSVAEYVVRHAPCPVLSVHPDDRLPPALAATVEAAATPAGEAPTGKAPVTA